MQRKKHEKGSEKGGAVPAKEAGERSTKQEVRSKNAEERVNERRKLEWSPRNRGCSARSTKKEARKEGQSQRKKQAKEARNKKLEARIQKQELTSDGS